MILCLPCDVHARLTLGVKIMVELRNPTNDWNDSLLVIARRDYRDYPLHANNFFGECEIITAKCCVVKRVLENPRLVISSTVFGLQPLCY